MRFSNDDGKSIDSAVKITDVPSHDEMIGGEYEYIGRKFKRHFPIGQELVQKNGRAYDVVTIRTLPFFRRHQIWFDITEGFNKLKGDTDDTGITEATCVVCGTHLAWNEKRKLWCCECGQATVLPDKKEEKG